MKSSRKPKTARDAEHLPNPSKNAYIMEKRGCRENFYDVVEIDRVFGNDVRVVKKSVSEGEAERMVQARDEELHARKMARKASEGRDPESNEPKKCKHCGGGIYIGQHYQGCPRASKAKYKPGIVWGVYPFALWQGGADGRVKEHPERGYVVREVGPGVPYGRMTPLKTFRSKKMADKMSDELTFGPAHAKRDPMKKSKKFERCVKSVKKQGRAVNPWAVCHASTGRDPSSKEKFRYKVVVRRKLVAETHTYVDAISLAKQLATKEHIAKVVDTTSGDVMWEGYSPSGRDPMRQQPLPFKQDVHFIRAFYGVGMRPVTAKAKAWFKKNLKGATKVGGWVAVENRYVDDIIYGMERDGLWTGATRNS